METRARQLAGPCTRRFARSLIAGSMTEPRRQITASAIKRQRPIPIVATLQTPRPRPTLNAEASRVSVRHRLPFRMLTHRNHADQTGHSPSPARNMDGDAREGGPRRPGVAEFRCYKPRSRPMTSFMISVVPPKIVWIRTST